MPAKITPGQVGDWLEVSAPGGGPPQRGRIVEVLGGPHHERYLVRWSDEHRSIHYPTDGTRIISGEDTGGPGPALP
jgi:hypothetical protein